jgi:hypothetical protein
VAVLGGLAAAQVIVEEGIRTDSVDVFAQRESGKSPALAMVASALVPGLGQEYLGKRGRAISYYAFEAALWFSVIYCGKTADKLVGDAKNLAWKYAAQYPQQFGGSGADESFWSNVGRYMDTEEYNRILELNRQAEIEKYKYLSDNLQWRWPTDSLRVEYNDIRSDASKYRVAISFLLAAVVVNHVVSFIDARVSTMSRGIRGSSLGLRVEPIVNGNAAGLLLRKEF